MLTNITVLRLTNPDINLNRVHQLFNVSKYSELSPGACILVALLKYMFAVFYQFQDWLDDTSRWFHYRVDFTIGPWPVSMYCRAKQE